MKRKLFQKNIKVGYSNKNIVQMIFKVLPVQFLMYVLGDVLNTINGIAISGTQSTKVLSAMAVCMPFSPFRVAFSIAVATGMVILCGHKVGSGNGNETKKVMTTAIINAVIAGAIFAAIVIIFRVPIARFLGANDEIVDYAADYLFGAALGIVPVALISVLTNIIQMNGKFSDAIKFAVVQIVLAFVIVFSTAYIFKGNIFQISMASSVSALLATIIMYIYVRRKTLGRIHFIKEFHVPYVWKIALLGIPASIIPALTGVRDIFLTNRIVSLGGVEATAAMGILGTIWFLSDGATFGTGGALGNITSVSFGERDFDSIKNIFKEGVKYGLVLTIVIGVIYFIFDRAVISFLTNDPAVIEIAVKLTRIFLVSRIVTTWAIIIISIFQSCKKSFSVIVLNLLSFLVFPIIGIFLTEDALGLDAVWWSYTIGPAAALLLWVIICIIKNRKFPSTIGDTLLLDDAGSIRKSWLMTSKKQAVIVSEEMMHFLQEKGASARDSFICALCLEETVINIYDNAFGEDDEEVWIFDTEDEKCVDIRLCIEEGHIMMRFRDNAKKFDLSSQASVYNSAPDDIIKNVGYRMISKYAKEITYNRIYSMNILRIEI